MKDLHVGMMNPKTGEPFSWDDPNVFTGDPGYYLEPGDNGYVPYEDEKSNILPLDEMLLEELVSAPAKSSDAPNALMKYHYGIMPRAGGGFSTRPILADSFNGDSVDAAVSEVTGLPEHKCAEVLAAYMDQLFMCSAGNRWAHAIHNLLSMLPSLGDRERIERRACAAG